VPVVALASTPRTLPYAVSRTSGGVPPEPPPQPATASTERTAPRHCTRQRISTMSCLLRVFWNGSCL